MQMWEKGSLGGGMMHASSTSDLKRQQYAYVNSINYKKGMFSFESNIPYILRDRQSPPVLWHGDSGGPMWLKDSEEGPYLKLIGINSAGNTLSFSSYITALTNDSEFNALTWLKINIK